MKVTSKQEAWNKVNEIFPTDYEQDLGIRWGTIQGISIDHYTHGKNGENGGHFIVQGYVALREPD